ncbi:MAG: hypothetical protein WAM39_02545 [Bryobacteraceae bacterium]
MRRKQQLVMAINTIANLIRSVHLKRSLAAIDPNPALNFWRLLYGQLLDIAVLDWCKLFGSDDEEHQPVHWKNVFEDHDGFRSDMLKAVNATKSDWDAYWKEMKTYRDTHVAHLDFKNGNGHTSTPSSI